MSPLPPCRPLPPPGAGLPAMTHHCRPRHPCPLPASCHCRGNRSRTSQYPSTGRPVPSIVCRNFRARKPGTASVAHQRIFAARPSGNRSRCNDRHRLAWKRAGTRPSASKAFHYRACMNRFAPCGHAEARLADPKTTARRAPHPTGKRRTTGTPAPRKVREPGMPGTRHVDGRALDRGAEEGGICRRVLPSTVHANDLMTRSGDATAARTCSEYPWTGSPRSGRGQTPSDRPGLSGAGDAA